VLVKEVLMVCVCVMLKVMEASTLYIYVHQMAVNGDGMFSGGMAKFGRSWWRFSVHTSYISYHHPLVFVDARNTQNEITLDGFRNMVQDFTDVPQLHLCICCVCCLLHERMWCCE
jgi:hypothetical protein